MADGFVEVFGPGTIEGPTDASELQPSRRSRSAGDQPSEAQRKSPPTLTSRGLRWLTRIVTVLFWLGLLVRLTVADRILVASTIYYGTPWSVLTVLALFCAGMGRKNDSWRPWCAAAACCALPWIYGSWSCRSTATTSPTVRVVEWNVAHGHRGMVEAAAALAQLEPDLAILIEADPHRIDTRNTLQNAFPDYHITIMGAGMVVISRWPAGTSIPYPLGDPYWMCGARKVEVETPFGPWTVFAVDMGSSPCYSRREPLHDLARLIEQCGDQPCLVAGDFNTPVDSVHYQDLRVAGLREMFTEAGSGYQATWPVPVPVLSLDQIWISPHLQPVACIRHWSRRSDHAAVIATISQRPAQP